MAQDDRVVIQSLKEDGSRLRPSDWIERISSILANFGDDNRLQYSNSVKPCIIKGQKCLVVARCLSDSNPEVYNFIMAFAKSNQLVVQEDRRQGDRALACAVNG